MRVLQILESHCFFRLNGIPKRNCNPKLDKNRGKIKTLISNIKIVTKEITSIQHFFQKLHYVYFSPSPSFFLFFPPPPQTVQQRWLIEYKKELSLVRASHWLAGCCCWWRWCMCVCAYVPVCVFVRVHAHIRVTFKAEYY